MRKIIVQLGGCVDLDSANGELVGNGTTLIFVMFLIQTESV